MADIGLASELAAEPGTEHVELAVGPVAEPVVEQVAVLVDVLDAVLVVEPVVVLAAVLVAPAVVEYAVAAVSGSGL